MGITKSFYILEQIRRDDLLEKSGQMVTTEVSFIRHTNRAILIYAKIVVVKATLWLPKSQVLEPDPVALKLAKAKDELVLIIPLWLAKTNSLTYKEVKNDSCRIK